MKIRDRIVKILFVNKEYTNNSLTNLVITTNSEDDNLYKFLKNFFKSEIYITKRSDGSINYIIKDVDFEKFKKFVSFL